MALNLNELEWRYATKKFNPSKKISETQFKELLETLRLAPSSFGLQPWKFIVVKDDALRQRIKTVAWNQSQVVDASHLIVLCVPKKIDEAYVKNFVAQIAKVRNLPIESLKSYEDMMLGFIKSHSEEWLSNWMKRQLYIAFGFLMYACAQVRIDSCPMEGFDPSEVDKLLKLSERGLESVALCPIGYRADDDSYASLKKVRFEDKELFFAI